MRTQTFIIALASAVITTSPLYGQESPSAAIASSQQEGTSGLQTAGEAVTFKNGTTTRTGTVMTPNGDGKHAGVVIVFGGDKGSAAAAEQIAKTFAENGIVALTYTTAAASADEASAAVEVLKQRGDVHPDAVGIVGIGGGTSVVGQVAKSDNLRYVVAVAPAAQTGDMEHPEQFGALPQRVLVVRGMADAFSEQTDKYQQSVQKNAHNVTFWPAPDEDIGGLGAKESALLLRIAGWARDRSA